ncbi:MAG TPA: alpha/beta fold hydrolase [Ktedonobacteraceae bacterium]
MSTYVLIHASWHGGWCWNKVAPLLERAGHRVVAPDLPGHGQDTTPLFVITPQLILQRLTELLDCQAEPIILVGHSSGGMLITALASLRPEKIKMLVYLSAFLLPPGVLPPMLAREDTESILSSSLLVDEQRRLVRVKPEAAKAVFYADCTDEDAAWATSLLVPEPLLAPTQGELSSTPPSAETERNSISRAYIECLRDKALGPITQKKMYTALPCQEVYSLQTSHSPFLSAPEQLVACLIDTVS